MMILSITQLEKQELQKAKKILENPSFSMKIANKIGKPIEFGLEKMNSDKINAITQKALQKSLDSEDDGAESAYFSARGVMAFEMKVAVDSIANMSSKAIKDALATGQLPLLIKVINLIASRFGVTVSEKLVAQSIPIIGALGGASLNLMFMNHFQNMAEGHFIVKRLERKYGLVEIQRVYESL